MAKRDHRLQYIDFHPSPIDSSEYELSESIASLLIWLLIIAIAGSLGFIGMQMYSLHSHTIEQIIHT